jgi:hypothetical protein
MTRLARIVGLALVVSALGGSPAPARADDGVAREVSAIVAQALFERGLKLFHEGRFAEARALFQESIAELPDGPYAQTSAEMVRRCDEKLAAKSAPPPPSTAPAPSPQPPPSATPPAATDVPLDPYASPPGPTPAPPPAPAVGDAPGPPLDPYGPPTGAPVPPPAPAPVAAPEPAPVDPYAGDSLKTSPSLELNPGSGLALEPPYGDEPPASPRALPPADAWPRTRLELTIFGGVLGGAMLGMAADAAGGSGAIAPGVLVGGAAGLGGAFLATRGRDISQGQAEAIMAGAVWGGLYGGLLTHLADDPSRADRVARGTYETVIDLGGILGLGGGTAYALLARPSASTTMFANSLGGIGLAGGLMLGVAFQPPDDRAYSINALVGATAGLTLGLWGADKVRASRTRMLIVDGAVLGSGLLGLALFEGGAGSDRGAKQLAGGAGLAAMIAGGVTAWFLTSGMPPDAPETAPRARARGLAPALVAHDDDGWHLGTPAPVRVPAGYGVSLVGGTF